MESTTATYTVKQPLKWLFDDYKQKTMSLSSHFFVFLFSLPALYCPPLQNHEGELEIPSICNSVDPSIHLFFHVVFIII